MSLKTLEYRVKYALALAENDKFARILIAVGNWEKAKYVFAFLQSLTDGEGFTLHLQTMTAKHLNGGVIRVVNVQDQTDQAGAMITHLWVDETLHFQDAMYLRTRVRSSKDHDVPPGVFDQFGVTRRMDY